MKIKVIESQCLVLFWAIYECEHCGHEERLSGYDDDHFHRNVIPAMPCKKCGKTAPDGFRPVGTKYAEHEQV